MMDTEYEYIIRTYSKCNFYSSYEYDKSDIKYSFSDEEIVNKSQKDSQTNTVLTINSFDSSQYNTRCQHHEIIHEVQHVQVEEPKLIQEHALAKPLTEKIPIKQSLELLIPKAQQETLANG